MLYGYARISTKHQSTDCQVDRLNAAGCSTVVIEQKSGKARDRAELDRLLTLLQTGDTLVVTKLDRLCRSLKDLLAIVEELQTRNVTLKSLDNELDIDSAVGKFTLSILGAVAEFERTLIVERIVDGLAHAKANGKKLGRQTGAKLNRTIERQEAIAALSATGMTPTKIAKHLSISRQAVHRYLS